MTAKPYSRTSKNLKFGKRNGKWISTQVNVKSFTSHGQEIQLSTPTSFTAKLQEVDHAKSLGLDISRDLCCNNHIQNVTVEANRTLGVIRRNIHTKRKGIRETASNTLVRPSRVCLPVWSPYIQANINKVEKVQRRAARWVSNDYSSYRSVTQMLNTLRGDR